MGIWGFVDLAIWGFVLPVLDVRTYLFQNATKYQVQAP